MAHIRRLLGILRFRHNNNIHNEPNSFSNLVALISANPLPIFQIKINVYHYFPQPIQRLILSPNIPASPSLDYQVHRLFKQSPSSHQLGVELSV